MRDFYKAALRCIQVFIESKDIKQKVLYLYKAEEHFHEASSV